jgi:hypothetical protein
MLEFKWITNDTDDYLQYVTHRGDRFLPVRSEREILIALTAMALMDTPDNIPDDAKKMDLDLESFEVLFEADHGGSGGSDPSKIWERAEAILGYDALTEWGLGKIRRFSAPIEAAALP